MRFENQRARVAVLGEKLTRSHVGRRADPRWRHAARLGARCAAGSNSRKASRSVRLTCRRLSWKGARRSDGCSL